MVINNNNYIVISRLSKLLTIVLVVFVLVYISSGSWLSVPIENDGMRIALGVQGSELYGNYMYSYNYDEQAGTYKLISLVSEALGLKPFDAFSILTSIASLLFLITGALFLKRIIPTTFLISILALLLFQEIYVSGYYPNSSMVAAVFLSTALILVTFNEQPILIALSAGFFAIAVWCRFDAILIAGAFLWLMVDAKRPFAKLLALFSIVFLSVVGLLFFISDVSLKTIPGSYFSLAGKSSSISSTLNTYSTIFTLAVIFFIALGLYYLWKSRNWRSMILTAVGSDPIFLAYGFSVLSPKYLLYALVFLAIPVCNCFGIIANKYKKERGILFLAFFGTILIAGQYVFTPPFELVFNRPTVVSTADHVRLRGSISYSPLYWLRQKIQMQAFDVFYLTKLDQYIEAHDPAYIISQDWMSNQWVMYYLQLKNFRVKEQVQYAEFLEDGQRVILQRGDKLVYLLRWRADKPLDLPSELTQEIENMPSILYIGPFSPYSEPQTYAKDSFLSERFQYKQWDQWMRFYSIEYYR
jgi:hypothetical protein